MPLPGHERYALLPWRLDWEVALYVDLGGRTRVISKCFQLSYIPGTSLVSTTDNGVKVAFGVTCFLLSPVHRAATTLDRPPRG